MRVIGFPTPHEAIRYYRDGSSNSTEWPKIEGRLDALVLLLLSFCPYLTSIHLGTAFRKHSELFGPFLRTAIISPESNNLPSKTFHRLSKVEFGLDYMSNHHFCGETTADALSFFHLPDLQHLQLALNDPERITWPANMTPSSVPKITSLSLLGPRERQLGQLLAPLRRLRSLQWRCCLRWFRPDPEIFDLDIMVDSLQQAKELRDLVIGICATEIWRPEFAFQGNLNNFADGMPSLRRLQIPFALVMGLRPCANSLKTV